MCYGHCIRCQTCTEVNVLYYDDGECDSSHRPNHLVIGRNFRISACSSCKHREAEAERQESEALSYHHERAKALLEYFRGERATPRTDTEILHAQFDRGERLHPWADINLFTSVFRTELRAAAVQQGREDDQAWLQAMARRLVEMATRQVELDHSGELVGEGDRELWMPRLMRLINPVVYAEISGTELRARLCNCLHCAAGQ
jgi:hypothetical protein